MSTPAHLRIARWHEVAAAVAGGCPVPVQLYIARDARMVRLSCTTAEDVRAWASRLGMPEPAVETITDAAGQQHRTTQAERGGAHGADLLVIGHSEPVEAGEPQ